MKGLNQLEGGESVVSVLRAHLRDPASKCLRTAGVDDNLQLVRSRGRRSRPLVTCIITELVPVGRSEIVKDGGTTRA